MAHMRITPCKHKNGEGNHVWQLKGVLVDALATPSQPKHPAAQATVVAPSVEAVTVSALVHPEVGAHAPRIQPSMGWQRRCHTNIMEAHQQIASSGKSSSTSG